MERKKLTQIVILMIALLLISFLTINLEIYYANAISESRFFRSDYHHINCLNVQALVLGLGTTADVQSMSSVVGGTYQIGIRIWIRNPSEIEDEITNGYPVAIINRTLKTGSAQGYQSATWECPESYFISGSSVVVKSYIRKYPTSWYSEPLKPFTTDKLSGDKLNNTIWTVTYWTWLRVGTSWLWEYGYEYAQSRIENFCYSYATKEQLYSESNTVTDGLTLNNPENANGDTLGDYADVNSKWFNENWEFILENHTVEGSLNAIFLLFKHYQSGFVNDVFKLQIFNGSTWLDIMIWNTTETPPTSDSTFNFDLSGIIDNWLKVDSVEIRIISTAKTGSEDSVTWYVDRVKLRVFYSEIDTEAESFLFLFGIITFILSVTYIIVDKKI